MGCARDVMVAVGEVGEEHLRDQRDHDRPVDLQIGGDGGEHEELRGHFQGPVREGHGHEVVPQRVPALALRRVHHQRPRHLPDAQHFVRRRLRDGGPQAGPRDEPVQGVEPPVRQHRDDGVGPCEPETPVHVEAQPHLGSTHSTLEAGGLFLIAAVPLHWLLAFLGVLLGHVRATASLRAVLLDLPQVAQFQVLHAPVPHKGHGPAEHSRLHHFHVIEKK
mmetsp:Transcript_40796/g.66759  ORF Transcript_40796/g.66759 Transcript_40796/m.66759 type:complete len:220 (+) Transcript_40796:696-1355(+)